MRQSTVWHEHMMSNLIDVCLRCGRTAQEIVEANDPRCVLAFEHAVHEPVHEEPRK